MQKKLKVTLLQLSVNMLLWIFITQVYAQADETDVSTALTRNSETGEVDVSGDGQVSFKVNWKKNM